MINTQYDTDRILKTPPLVAPVDAAIVRPVWSVMIPVFNCSRFLPDTLNSVLQQDEGSDKMQITVVDDASTDTNVERLVFGISDGRVEYVRQRSNVGSLRNFHTCLTLSKGHLIHLLHGDDLVRPGFYTRMKSLFDRYPKIGAGYCRFGYRNEEGTLLFTQNEEEHHEGLLENWLERISERQLIQYAAMVVKREVYEKLGGFYGVEYGEDWEMWTRIAAKYRMGYVPEVLADYRQHSKSISGQSFLTAKNMRDLQFVMSQIQKRIPL